MKIENQGRFCLNYWNGEELTLTATIKIGDSYYPLVGIVDFSKTIINFFLQLGRCRWMARVENQARRS